MKRILLSAAAAAAVLMGSAAVAAPAMAGTSPNGSSGSSTPGHFAYNDLLFGPVTCNEVHHPKNSLPAGAVPAGAVTTGGYDDVTCRLANPQPPGETGVSFWLSDFGTKFDNNTGLIDFTVSADGMSYHGVAWYPNG